MKMSAVCGDELGHTGHLEVETTCIDSLNLFGLVLAQCLEGKLHDAGVTFPKERDLG